MKVYRFERLGNLAALRLFDEPIPKPQRGEVLIKVRAVALNRRDLLIVLGGYPGSVTPGLVPCSDAAGEIVEVGDGVSAHRIGDRVINNYFRRWFGGSAPKDVSLDTYGNCRDGWLTEYKVVSEEAVVPMPASLSWEEASTLPCAGVTAWNALSGDHPVRAGQTVLTLGSGGVSVFSIQLSKAVGAQVIATTSSEDKKRCLLDLGADHVINYNEVPEWGMASKELTHGLGVDRVVDVVGPSALNQAFASLRRGGEVVQIGQLSSHKSDIDTSLVKSSRGTLRSIGVGDRSLLEELVRVVDGCRLKPVVHKVFAFDDALAGFEHLARNLVLGKTVINVDS